MNKKVKTILSIVLLAVLASLMIGITMVNLLKKDFLKPTGLKNTEPAYVKVYKKASQDYEMFEKGSEEYNKIMELYNDSFSESIMNLIFNGKLKEDVTVTNKTQSSLLTSVVAKATSTIYVQFCYNTPQEMMLNGEVYKNTANNSQKYLSLLMEVRETTEMEAITIYVERANPKTIGGETHYTPYSDRIYSSYRYNTFAKQADLYSYLEEIR